MNMSDHGSSSAQTESVLSSAPTTVMALVLRAEAFEARQEWYLAEADYEQALRRASARITEDSWGILEQVCADRAQCGLKRIYKRLGAAPRMADAASEMA